MSEEISELFATREEQIEEAKKRLQILVKLGLMEVVYEDFTNGLVHYSERNNDPWMCLLANNPQGGGGLFWINQEATKPAIREAVKVFEEKHNAVVFHATHERTNFGEILDLLYVSKYKEEWDRDRAELKEGYPFVWVENLSDPNCSEFGAIKIQASGGGLIRIA